ncbi:Oxygen-independent coproporphyrinogen-III oxidase-like protein [Durusdinium trenchii]|uniref:Oxygen-independent coproporphyrinogen-III oxidase-like protein n=1 Tax=Durusdinium trenchii TaxID=1381693 RepID=A0ABP0KQD5_9DINO
MLLKTLLTEGVSFAAGSSKFREGVGWWHPNPTLPDVSMCNVDVAFTPEWSKVITQLSQAQPPQDPEQEEQWRQDAMCLARLVSKLHIEVDSAGVAPADVPASELPAPKVGQGSKTLPPQKSPPSHRSLYFMPPGQPGEKRLALYPAQWLRQLTTSRWALRLCAHPAARKFGFGVDVFESELVKRAKTEVLPKLRAAIESIELDQEAFRMSTPLLSLKTFLATGSAAAVSGLATVLLTSPSLFVLAPSLTTIIFLHCSYSESAAARSSFGNLNHVWNVRHRCAAVGRWTGRYKAKAKFNYGQSSKIASTAEGSLATAEARKVFFPFGVGLTAITAAACVTLRIFNEKVGSFFPEPAGGSFSTVLAGDNVILMLWPKSRTCSFERILFALASVVGASATSLTYVSTRAALVMDDMRQSGARSDWEASRLPKIIKDPTREDERNVVIFTILFCFLPLPFLVDGFDLSLADSNRLLFNKAVQQFLDDASVAISASAAAQAAVAFLLGEKDFTDAEQRCAMQSKQAALAEMFCAQAQQEAAIIPV